MLDSNGTNDADGDITRREWRLYVPGDIYPTVISNDAVHSTNLDPGVHHISLFVEDRRGGIDEVHLNITVASSSPDLSNLTASPNTVIIDELVTIEVSVELDDPDGTTNQVTATLTRNLQVWEFNLTDDDGDGIWTGEIKITPGEVGTAQLKVTALDGENLDYTSINLDFKKEENDNTSMIIAAASVGGFLLLLIVIGIVIIRRGKRLADIDLIDSWGVFGAGTKEVLADEVEENQVEISDGNPEENPEEN